MAKHCEINGWNYVDAILPYLGDTKFKRLGLTGPMGCSKSSFAYVYSQKQKKRVFKVPVNPHLSPAEMIGFYQMVDGNFRWWDGPAVQALKTGGVLLLDEIGKMGDEIYTTMLTVLDDPSTLVIDLPTGEQVRPAPGFCVVATSNFPIPQLPEAVADRFDVTVYISSPSPEAIDALGPGLDQYCRNLYSNGHIDMSVHQRPITYRRLATYKYLSSKLDKKLAAEILFGTEAEDFLNALAVSE